MIPSVLAQQLRQGVEDFLRTTFPVSTPFFNGIIERLLSEDGGVFKGPYISIQLPFRQGEGGKDFFTDVYLEMRPYLHQERAFERLSGPNPRSTIIATGTGSGKTECFLYPILDYCYQHREEPGIKAVIIYPMNALATDQAGRLARVIWKNQGLRGRITAGLFVGQGERESYMAMGPDHIITNKDTQRLSPPDILLTNYKMLDFLLIRPKDYPLWKQNGPDTLRFLVVDELHTFDGAQGTDLACLVRRLKARLRTPAGRLCCVGTSATLGSEREKETLAGYAGRVFGEPFERDGIITESQINPGEFLGGSPIAFMDIPPPERAKELDPEQYDGYREYIRGQHKIWFGEGMAEEDLARDEWKVALGERLKGHLFFQRLLKVLGGKVLSLEGILARLDKITREIRETDASYRENLLTGILSLVSEARVWRREKEEEKGDKEASATAPFLQVRFHLWLRELRRMVCEVGIQPRLRFADDLNDEQRDVHLPAVHCRECGAMGWSGIKRKDDNKVIPDLQGFYISFFSDDPKVVFLFPEGEDGAGMELDGAVMMLCPSCLLLIDPSHAHTCPSCAREDLIRVFLPNTRMKKDNRMVGVHNCPYCGATGSLTLIGSRAASLTSVLISQLYSSNFNDDKKLLAFSDSVQDAAHRAGFFAGRTYRFNFRTALQRCVMDGGEGLTLAELPDAFIRYWSERMDEKSYIATFIAPNMEWLHDYDYLKAHGSLPKESRLRAFIEQRIDWEIKSEYGFSARIGRTLEKTGVSVVHLDPGGLKRAADALLEPLRNEIGGLRGLDDETLRRFLVGLIVHMKNKGAVTHQVLKGYIEGLGKTYLISQRHIRWLPNFGPKTRTPVFLTDHIGSSFDRVISPSPGFRSWYQDWAQRSFSRLYAMERDEAGSLYQIVLGGLVDQGILDEVKVKNDRVWGIKPDALRISTRVLQFYCDRCSHNVSVEASERALWEGAPCLRFHCKGSYTASGPRVDYYGKLYTCGDVKRIFAAEHTGLLTREERERVEAEFKGQGDAAAPWAPNLLSCTPTLELGIDIGDLSSVVLCSAPPAQANYLQRIGRSGRRDGNSVNLTVANALPHDLYFFAEPEEMISGEVETPGIFLDASAVLERQFTTFCFDRWVESGINPSAIPNKLGDVLNSLAPQDEKKFPYNLLSFIGKNQEGLLSGFLAMFPGSLTQESIGHIKCFVEGDKESQGSLGYRIMEGLYNLDRDRDSLRRKIQTLRKMISKKEQDPAKGQNYDNEMREIEWERNALQALVRVINNRETFNFFTDEGLIPNYAFPEAGVILRSIIYRRREVSKEEDKSGYETWAYEYERPSVRAVVELAPDNLFYAGGRSVRVDQVDMTVAEVEQWRFCNNCSHMEMVGKEAERPECPRCKSPMWSDAGQKRQMVRMRQVFATTPDSRSRISDEKDQREPKFYNKQMLVDFDERHITDAYKVDSDELPFGFEFLEKATFREVNFGEKGEFGENVVIAGVELPRKGFTLCRICGKIQDHKGEIRHALTCTARNQESKKNFIDCVYLYREFSSEAIRILLPITTFTASDRKLHSFVAAIQLGLKKRFGGKIDHINATIYDEPVPESTYHKRYLILYDAIPGGTGYLKQLMRSESPLLEVFDIALAALMSCSCNREPDKDGCYRCLYAYRNSYLMKETSRDTAIELLSEILKHKGHLVKIDTLNRVSVNVLFDSELEARFIDALKQLCKKNILASLSKELVNGKPGWFFTIGERAYHIEPQVPLGAKEGIGFPISADFVFWPARGHEDSKPIAVFTDGFLYHRDRIGEDMRQRMAIAQGGRFYVWSLTWKDVENRYASKGGYFQNYINPGTRPRGDTFMSLVKGYGLEGFRNIHMHDSFEWLIRYLGNPDENAWGRYAFIHGLVNIDPHCFESQEAVAGWERKLEGLMPEGVVDLFGHASGSPLYGLFEQQLEWGEPPLQLFFKIAKEAVSQNDIKGLRIGCWLDDRQDTKNRSGFEAVWNGYLRLYNLFQFLPHAFFVTYEGVAKNVYEDVKFAGDGMPVVAPGGYGEIDAWKEAKDLTDPGIHALLDTLRENGWPAPEAGYELVNTEGEIVATAELAWEGAKIAFLKDDEYEYSKRFEESGWRVAALFRVLAEPDPWLLLFKKKDEV